MYDFEYLIDKIENSDFSSSPFKHIYLEDFFSSEHFAEIIASEEVAVPAASTDEQLIDALYNNGFKVIPFPGCVTDIKQYVNWHQHKTNENYHTACEGFGMALRLYVPKSPILQELDKFLAGDKFNSTITKKFGIEFEDCVIDGGIQKYLDGYEISPHPDIRKKAATFMVNINPSPVSESCNHHTHYLNLKSERAYVKSFWEGNPDIERAWVPWDWSETVFQQTKNNSIVLFSPSNDTLHGVKADYDHLKTQRTQLYGNLWYKERTTKAKLEWEDLDLITKASTPPKPSNQPVIKFRETVANVLPRPVKAFMKKGMSAAKEPGKRNI